MVVKIQRPGLADVIERDLEALGLVAGLAQRRTEFASGGRRLATARPDSEGAMLGP